ncbi:MAG: amidohydrolase family protein, partial [Planctomycetota bacterium JB042]
MPFPSLLTVVRLVPVALLLGGPLVAARAAADEPLVIESVSVVDVEAGTAEVATVVVEDGEVAAVLPAFDAVPAGGRTIDGRGLFLVPGLIDAHVHFSTSPDLFGPMMVANGVLAARDAGAETGTIVRLRGELASRSRVGPELLVTGAIVDGDPPVWPFSKACGTPELARAAVRELAAAGVDQIKVYSRLSSEAWAAAIEEAHAHGLKATGHVPAGASVDDARALGQDWIDHLSGFDVLIGRHVDGESARTDAGEWSAFGFWRHLGRADAAALDAAYGRLAEAGTVVCPTLVVMEGIARAADPSARDAALAPFVPAHLLAFWTSPRYRGFGARTPLVIPPMKEVVRALHRRGVRLVVGTDLANPFVHAGFSVHREMELWQEAGVPAADVLRAATIVPARALGVDDRLGSILPGKTASMVLVRRNPLIDVRHLAGIEAVVDRGTFLDRAALDGLLADARSLAGHPDGGDEVSADDGAAPDSAPLAPPGEEIARGTLAMTWSGFDAGVEAFAITRHDGGYRLQARSLPTGGFEKPFFVDFSYGGEGRFREGVFRELVDGPLEATYGVDDGVVEAFARRAGEPLPPRTLDLAPGALVEAPVFAGALFSLHRLGLAPGESREIEAVSLGRPTWEPRAAPVTIRRLDDADWSGLGGPSRARRYAHAYETPMGTIDFETWTDARGIVLKAILTMPMGKLVAERSE